MKTSIAALVLLFAVSACGLVIGGAEGPVDLNRAEDGSGAGKNASDQGDREAADAAKK